MGLCLFRVHQMAVHWKANTNLFKQWLVPHDSHQSVDSVGTTGFWWCICRTLLVHLGRNGWRSGCTMQKHHYTGMLHWEWGNKDVHLVTTFVFCHVSKCYFSTGVSLRKRVRKMPKSGTGHGDGLGFRGHIYVMHQNNSSLPLGNKMVELSNIDSCHETIIHIANHGCVCSNCVQIIQQILLCDVTTDSVISIGIAYNGFCVPRVQSNCQLGISGMT